MSITLLPQTVEADVREDAYKYRILAYLQVLDVLTTGLILSYYVNATEGNPIVDFVFNTVGLVPGLAAILVLKLAVVYTLWACQTGTRIANAIYGLVVANNLLFLALWLTS